MLRTIVDYAADDWPDAPAHADQGRYLHDSVTFLSDVDHISTKTGEIVYLAPVTLNRNVFQEVAGDGI